MTLKEKIFIKFVRIFPFFILIGMGVGSVELLNSYYFNNGIDLYDSNGEFLFTMYDDKISSVLDRIIIVFMYIGLFVLSNRMNFCYYHKTPILFLIFSFITIQILESFIITSDNFYVSYYLSLISIVIAFALSIYLYKHKKPNKR